MTWKTLPTGLSGAGQRAPWLVGLAAASLWIAATACSGGVAADAVGGGGTPADAGYAATSEARPTIERTRAEAAEPEATPVASDARQEKQFPPRDHLNKIVQAYNVANDHPELLAGIPCYCPCELYGHGAVIDCYRSQHAASCNVCLDEAVQAGQLLEAQLRRGQGDMASIQAAVKDRYRRALMAQKAQELPGTDLPQGQAFLQVCSDCHQPPSPAMHTPADWGPSLARMEQYARARDAMPSQSAWQGAAGYVNSLAGQVPASTVAQVRQQLQDTVDYLKSAEGDSAYYPSVRDEVLTSDWFQRMADAYRTARNLPTELLASTPTSCNSCVDAGHTNLLACLNSWHAITCETAVEEIEKLAAEQ